MGTRRGFPWHLALTARQFLDAGEAMFQAAPTIQDVILNRLGRNMPRLAACPTLRNVRSLSFFETPFRSPEAVAFAASPHLEGLRAFEIGFTDTRIGPAGATALAGARGLPSLERLDLGTHAIYDEGAVALARSEWRTALTALQLHNNGLTNVTAAALGEARHLQLTDLDLSANHLSGRGVAWLAGAEHLAGLRRLSVQQNRIGLDGATGLAAARFAGSLNTLRVAGCALYDRDLAILIGAGWERLKDLNLSVNAFSAAAASALSGNKTLFGLRELGVSRCGIGPREAASLGRASLPVLRTLNLGQNPIGPTGLEALLAGPLVSPLRHLDLTATDAGDAGAAAVAGCPAVVNLRWLQLAENHITDTGARALAESPHLADVHTLDLSKNDIGPAGKDCLTQRFGTRVRM
jgi:Ran GTPase-activating protein (RanGAP) involved in mRNA processing and transport